MKSIGRYWGGALAAACLVVLASVTPAPVVAQGEGNANLKRLQQERVALAKKLSASVVAVAPGRPELGQPPNTGMAGGLSKANSGFVVDDEFVISTFDIMGGRPRRPGRDPQDSEIGVGDTMWMMDQKRNEFSGKVVGKDRRNLLIVIKLDPGYPKLPSLKFANSDEVEMGAGCVSLGNSLDSIIHDTLVTFSYGTISGFYRFQPVNVLRPDEPGNAYRGNVFETDSAVHPGDWGGPLCNLDGDVVGMLTRHHLPGRHLGTAVPANQIRSVLPQLKKGVKEDDLPQAWCGFKAKSYDRANRGVVISEVNKGGPAEKAGLKAGMIVLRVDNHRVPSRARLAEMLGRGLIKRRVSAPGGFFPGRDGEQTVSLGLPIGTQILLTVKDPDTGKEKTVNLVATQKEDDF